MHTVLTENLQRIEINHVYRPGNGGKGGEKILLKAKTQKELKKTDVKNKKRKLARIINEKETAIHAPGLNEEPTSSIKTEPTKSKHATAKKKRCRFCRKVGHVMEKCREWTDKSKLCYKCGSGEHSVGDCKTTVPAGTLYRSFLSVVPLSLFTYRSLPFCQVFYMWRGRSFV